MRVTFMSTEKQTSLAVTIQASKFAGLYGNRPNVLRFGLLLLMFCFWVSGCASFPGKHLPDYTYADLAPAPEEEKICLVSSDKREKKAEDAPDATIAMFEKSGYFLKAPEHCTPTGDPVQKGFKVYFRNDTGFAGMAFAAASGFVSGASLLIIPAYARDDFVLTVQLKKYDQLVKEYVYHEHMNTWLHVSMLFMMPGRMPRATIHKIYARMIMNFLYDYSHDVQQGKLAAFSR